MPILYSSARSYPLWEGVTYRTSYFDQVKQTFQDSHVTRVLYLYPRQQRPSDRHQLDLIPMRNCRVDVWSMSIWGPLLHYGDVIMSAMASQITDVSSVHSTVCSGADQGKHQSSASLALVRGIHQDRELQRTSNVGNVHIWWRHHDPVGYFISLPLSVVAPSRRQFLGQALKSGTPSPEWALEETCAQSAPAWYCNTRTSHDCNFLQHFIGSSSVQALNCSLFGSKTFPKSMLTFCHMD